MVLIQFELVGHRNRRTNFLIQKNMAFSSRLFMVNVELNLQRKRYVQSKRVNLILLRFMLKLVCSKIKTSLKWTNFPRETEPDEKKKKKKERFCLQITTAQIGLTTQERQNQVKKKGRFCLQISSKPNTSLSLANWVLSLYVDKPMDNLRFPSENFLVGRPTIGLP